MRSDTASYSSDIAFSHSVKAVQARKGSRAAYEKMEARGSWEDRITPELSAFIGARRSAMLATASADGQPYVQHRGGPTGFLQVLDNKTIGFADFAGNRQYITLGNLAENQKAQLFLIDHTTRQRVKIWGTARVVDDDPALVNRLMPAGYHARADQAILFTVSAWDANCPQHIPLMLEADAVAAALAAKDEKIAALEADIVDLRQRLAARERSPEIIP